MFSRKSLKLTNLEYRHIRAKQFTLKRRKILIKVAVNVEDLAPKRKGRREVGLVSFKRTDVRLSPNIINEKSIMEIF